MARVYVRPGTRFWWIRYRDPATGKTVRKSTGIDVIAPNARRDAKREEGKWIQRENAAPRTSEKEQWNAWADAFFRKRYEGKGTLSIALISLRDLLLYFAERGIRTPRMVTYEVAEGFLPWRLNSESIYPIKQSTAHLRFSYFRILMSQAVRLGFCDANPCREVEVKRGVSKQKKEITPEHQAFIESKLAEKPRWMQEQWRVLMRQGCRIAETAVPMDRIDTNAMTITFKLKGGKLHTAQLHPDLLPIIETARSEGRSFLIEGPPVTSWSSIWSMFFRKHKLPYSIHCTRVSVITRLVRLGHSIPTICNFIGHTEVVSRIYQKLKPPDSKGILESLGDAPTPSSSSGQP